MAVHPSAEMYGSDRMFLETVTRLGDDVLAVLPAEGPLSTALRLRGIPYVVLDFPILRKVELNSPLAAVRFLWKFALAIPRLASWIRGRPPGGVYVSTVIAPVWIFAARLARRSVCCHVHESEPDMARLASRLLLFPLRAAHRVIANSHATRDWIEGSTGAKVRTRTIVLYNGVAMPVADDRDVPQPQGDAQLVLVGRLSHRKGQDVAIRAAGLLHARGRTAGLTLVGDCFPGYEDYVDHLKALVQDLGLGKHVLFAGFQANPYPYVSRADIALVPSRVEPFGLVAVEALMLARPTVASRVGGLGEVIIDRSTGRLVVPDDPEALADAIAELLDAPDAAAELARRGQADARQRFAPEAYAQGLRQVLSPP